MDISSKVELIASLAASIALFSPLAIPIPIKAEPAFDITALTSAKSALIIPGTVIISAIPCTPWRKTSSAILKASKREVFLSITDNNLSFEIVIIVSTLSANSVKARSAIFLR